MDGDGVAVVASERASKRRRRINVHTVSTILKKECATGVKVIERKRAKERERERCDLRKYKQDSPPEVTDSSLNERDM